MLRQGFDYFLRQIRGHMNRYRLWRQKVAVGRVVEL